MLFTLAEAIEAVTPAAIARHLYVAGLPDPDLIIRTSGENRLSGFLLWQSAPRQSATTSGFIVSANCIERVLGHLKSTAPSPHDMTSSSIPPLESYISTGPEPLNC